MSEPYDTIVKVEETKGIEAYREGNYALCAPLLKSAAKRGSNIAQSMYADVCYRTLDGKVRSKIKAAFWYLVATRMGDPNIYSYVASEIGEAFYKDENYKGMTDSEIFSIHLDLLVDAWNKASTRNANLQEKYDEKEG